MTLSAIFEKNDDKAHAVWINGVGVKQQDVNEYGGTSMPNEAYLSRYCSISSTPKSSYCMKNPKKKLQM